MSNARRAVVGAMAGAAWLAALFVAAPVVGGFAIDALAQAIVDSLPGWVSAFFIGLLGFWAQPLLVASLVVSVLGGSALLAVEWQRLPGSARFRRRFLGATIAIVTGALVFAAGASLWRGLVGVAIAIAAPFATVRTLRGPAIVRSNRRTFLRRVGTVAVAVAVGTAVVRRLAEGLRATEPSHRSEEPLPRNVSPPALPAVSDEFGFDFGDMPPPVTPPDEHYIVDKNVRRPTVNADGWSLDVHGMVAEPYSLSYEELLDHDGAVEQTTTMVCISNQVGGDLISTGHWTGVQLSELVAAAEPTEPAVDIVTEAADGYFESIPIEVVDREDILVAFGLGDRTLPDDNGFPARLLIPGRYGVKSTKWLTDIEISSRDEVAYWEQRGYDEQSIVNTLSYIRAAERRGDRIAIGGVAFGGLETGIEEIQRVEVRIDGDWHEAELEEQIAPHAWRRWRHVFTAPETDEFDIVVRAFDRDGMQTPEESPTRPAGATGWHAMTYDNGRLRATGSGV